MIWLWRLVTLATALLLATLLGGFVPLGRLFNAFQPLVVATSIMVAGILVRLNRGMPTLDWKGLAAADRKNLTQAIVSLNKQYLSILALNAAMALALVSLTVVGRATTTLWPDIIQRGVAAAVGGLLGLCLARVAYMVWRDVDIVKLQKTLIDGAAEQETLVAASAAADQKLEAVKGANLRRVGPAPVRDWNS